MKLTVAKLKQLILEQMNEDEFKQLNKLIKYLQELEKIFSSLPEDIQDQIDVYTRLENTVISASGVDFRSPLKDWFQVAIDSLARETEDPSAKKDWHFITISRWYTVSLGKSDMPGDIESQLKIYRDGSKRFTITQFDRDENELFNYYEGNDISTRGLIDFMTSDEENMVGFAKEHIKMNGETTLDSATL
jgi:hypothetical protein